LRLQRPLDSGRHDFGGGRFRRLVRVQILELASWAASGAAIVTAYRRISLVLRYNQADADDQRGDRLGYPQESYSNVSAIRILGCLRAYRHGVNRVGDGGEAAVDGRRGNCRRAMFWLAVKFADKIRRSNIMFRTLEVPLNLANSDTEVAETASTCVRGTFPRKRRNCGCRKAREMILQGTVLNRLCANCVRAA